MLTRTSVAAAAASLTLLLGCSPAQAPTARAEQSGTPVAPPTRTVTPSAPPTPTATPTPTPTTATSQPTPSGLPSVRLPQVRRPPRTDGLVRGGDVSWPQCPEGMGIPERRSQGLPMPLPSARFVVVGLTNGPGFTTNPCLEDQVRWVRERRLMASAYAVASFPDEAALARYGQDGPYDGDTSRGALSNAGYQQALLNVAAMQRAELLTPVVWVDVEPVADFAWSPDVGDNAAVVVGAAQAYADAGYGVGTYSTPALWQAVVGPLALALPEWRAAGLTSRAEALRRCRPDWSFQGGDAVLAQWVEGRRDHDITCPGIGRELASWFHQY